jgi:hypothetical protein
MRRRHPLGALRRRLPIAATFAAASVLAGCATHAAPPISKSDFAWARAFKQFTVYWAGLKVDGVPLTAVAKPSAFYSPGGFIAYYGDCGSRGTFHADGCTLPLKITTAIYSPHSDVSFGPQHWLQLHGMPAVVYHGGHDIEIYTDRQVIDISADSPARALAAAKIVRPFNRTPTVGFPAFPRPYYQPNVSAEQLAAQTAATGPTGATGATSDIRPPVELEPAPTSSGP